MTDRPASIPESATVALTNLEASRLEIALLALGILTLVVLLGALVWIGVKRRRRQSRSSKPAEYTHDRLSQSCLWREAFPDQHPRHGFLLLGSHSSDAEDEGKVKTLVERIRKKSAEIATVVHQDLMNIRRELGRGFSVLAPYELDPALRDVEVGMASGMCPETRLRWEGTGNVFVNTGADLSRQGYLRRHSSFMRGPEMGGVASLPGAPTSGGVRQGSS